MSKASKEVIITTPIQSEYFVFQFGESTDDASLY